MCPRISVSGLVTSCANDADNRERYQAGKVQQFFGAKSRSRFGPGFGCIGEHPCRHMGICHEFQDRR